MEILKRDEIILMHSLTKAAVQSWSDNKIIIISYLRGSMGTFQEIIVKNNSSEI